MYLIQNINTKEYVKGPVIMLSNTEWTKHIQKAAIFTQLDIVHTIRKNVLYYQKLETQILKIVLEIMEN